MAQNRAYIYQARHIFQYLETHINNNLAFDPLYQKLIYVHNPEILIHEMKQVYIDAVKDLPTNAPQP